MPNQRLLWGQRAIALTPKAFLLLRTLVERPNELITKDELLAATWPGVVVEEGQVRQFIGELRRLLSDDAEQPRFIETVRARGYRFIGDTALRGHDAPPDASEAPRAAAVVRMPEPAPPHKVEATLEALAAREQFIEARGLAEWHDGTLSGRYAFRHALYCETLYHRLGAARRVQWHARIGERLVMAHGERRAGEIGAAELASHFEQSRNFGRAARYRRDAADMALNRYDYRAALAHVEHGLALLGKQPGTVDTGGTELLLRLTQGAALLATKGFGAPEVEATYLRAQALSVGADADADTSARVLAGLWNLYLTRTEFAKAGAAADRLLDLAQRDPGPVPSMLAHNARGQVLLFSGDAVAALPHIERCQALYDARLHRRLAVDYGEDPVSSATTTGRWRAGCSAMRQARCDISSEVSRCRGPPPTRSAKRRCCGWTR